MEKHLDTVLKWCAAAAGAVLGFFGEWSAVLTILIICNAVDYLSGYLVAWAGKSPKTESGGVSSKVGFVGLAKKAFIWLVVLLATLLDKAVGNGTGIFQTAAALFYIANEGVSILENAALMGIPLPAFIRQALDAIAAQSEKTVQGAVIPPKSDPPDNE